MAILGAQVYVSEGRSPSILKTLKEVARSVPAVQHLQSFIDHPYNRTSFTLVSRLQDVGRLEQAVMQLTEAAISRIDMRKHEAQHPRLGSVDHISVHPLTQRPSPREQQEAGRFARSLATAVGSRLGVPTYTYGWASDPQGRALDDVRRHLGYFQGKEWRGSTFMDRPQILPDFGPSTPDPQRGVMCVGAVPWITNFNVQLTTNDLAVGRRIARALSQRNTETGMPGVQTMALEHEGGVIEVACNIIDPLVDPKDVEDRIRQLGQKEVTGPDVVRGSYVIGSPLQELIEKANVALGL